MDMDVKSLTWMQMSKNAMAKWAFQIRYTCTSSEGGEARHAYIGLAAAAGEGSWQIESKGYQFWVQTDSSGEFIINNVIPGTYSLHGWASGFIGDYYDKGPITISSGSTKELGNLTYIPPRHGPTQWEIGFPDQTAVGSYVPDPNPLYVNKLYLHSTEKYRQYGLWDRYTDMHPTSDQVYMVGASDCKRDWFFAHVYRRAADKRCYPSTWQIRFNLGAVISGVYKLRLSIASATPAYLQVRVNDQNESQPLFGISGVGGDNTIARHGIHGVYRLFSIDVISSLLVEGDNTIFLTLAKGGDEFLGVLYDYVRLESPWTSERPQWCITGIDHIQDDCPSKLFSWQTQIKDPHDSHWLRSLCTIFYS
ncbi:hypothetical protein AMTRI_Chr02g215750 [Amborella trichopoda]